MLRSLPRSPKARCLRWNSSAATAAAAVQEAKEPIDESIPVRQLFRGKPVRRTPADGRSQRSIFVRTWENMRGPLDALTIVQHLEKAFGRVDEFSPSKDEHASGNWILVRFRETESVARALASKGSFKIPSPPSVSRLNLGLNDIQPFLQSQKLDPDFTLTPHSETQTVSTKATATDSEGIIITISECSAEHETVYKSQSQPLSIRASRALVKWHGFASIKPLPPNTPLNTPDIDHPRMRAVVRRRVGMLQRRYPDLINPLESDEPASFHGQEVVEPPVGTDEQIEEEIDDWEPLVADDTLLQPQHVIEAEATTQPEVQTPPAPEPESKPKPSRLQPPPVDPAIEAALAAAQLKSANDMLESLRKPKPKAQVKKTKTQHKMSQPLFEADAGMEMKEEAALEPEKKANEVSEKEGDGAKGRFKNFLGGWF
ncbi:hypothetical protein Moror_17759 [Moniliophthora roreri MCA 2997]|uniref:Uncharacterized protein n=1 Tax=Moniliophthora roreri (strain MCA 2997) TaxID=1381753 RepID=V2XDQ7_MONRO|nr:hypothetical protein Moror_17759 [Moniliophthora roreri MCA 2997]